jgi:hypothetical protein
MSLLALALAQAHLAQCRHSLCNPIVKSNSNVQTRPQQHCRFHLAFKLHFPELTQSHDKSRLATLHDRAPFARNRGRHRATNSQKNSQMKCMNNAATRR